ncbi:MAG: type II toxin-antitoxin system VapC family toxin [Trueperaceae bacterium]
MNYWDTSTLLELYVYEQDSVYFRKLVAGSKTALVSSEIARVEVMTTLYRKELIGDIAKGKAAQHLAEFDEDVLRGNIVLLPITKDITLQAERVIKKSYQASRAVMVRALDTIHVASALTSKTSALVATDTRLRDVALLMGLKVLP